MTVSSCLDFCAQGNNGTTMNYAGIEYGRECKSLVRLHIPTEPRAHLPSHAQRGLTGKPELTGRDVVTTH